MEATHQRLVAVDLTQIKKAKSNSEGAGKILSLDWRNTLTLDFKE